jgi:hypothetical protein
LETTGEVYVPKVYVNPPADLCQHGTGEAPLLIDFDHPAFIHGFEIFLPTKPKESEALVVDNLGGGSFAMKIGKRALYPTSVICTIISVVRVRTIFPPKRR